MTIVKVQQPKDPVTCPNGWAVDTSEKVLVTVGSERFGTLKRYALTPHQFSRLEENDAKHAKIERLGGRPLVCRSKADVPYSFVYELAFAAGSGLLHVAAEVAVCLLGQRKLGPELEDLGPLFNRQEIGDLLLCEVHKFSDNIQEIAERSAFPEDVWEEVKSVMVSFTGALVVDEPSFKYEDLLPRGGGLSYYGFED